MVIRLSKTLMVALCFHTVTALAFCSSYPSPSEEFKDSEIVVVAKVIKEELVPDNEPTFYAGVLYYVKVERVLKGKPGPSFRLFSENTSARFPMEIGESYLVFANKENDLFNDASTYWINSCGNSKAWRDAHDVIRYFGKSSP